MQKLRKKEEWNNNDITIIADTFNHNINNCYIIWLYEQYNEWYKEKI